MSYAAARAHPTGQREVPPGSRRQIAPAAGACRPMDTTPRIIHNPVSGERIEFLHSSPERLEFELQLAPDGKVPGAHVHPEQEERFHVLEGTMKFRLGLRTIVAGPGETVIVP